MCWKVLVELIAVSIRFLFTVYEMVSFHSQTCLSLTDTFIAHQNSAGKLRALHPECLFSDRLQFDEYYGTPHPFT
jgi:hypothetical protein